MHFSHDTFLTLLRLQILHLTENSHGPDESDLPGWYLAFIFQSPVKGHTSHLAAMATPRGTWPSTRTSQEMMHIPRIPHGEKGASLFLPHTVQTQEVWNS